MRDLGEDSILVLIQRQLLLIHDLITGVDVFDEHVNHVVRHETTQNNVINYVRIRNFRLLRKRILVVI